MLVFFRDSSFTVASNTSKIKMRLTKKLVLLLVDLKFYSFMTKEEVGFSSVPFSVAP